MFTNVIAAVDGFDGGRDAVALAAALTSGRLTLVGVHPEDPHRTRASLEGFWRAQHDDLLRALEIERDRSAPGADVVIVGDTSPARALHRVAEEREADLLVLGSAHHGAAGRITAGDVGRAVLHGAPCPVAIAPKRLRRAELATVAVAVDGSPESRAALEVAARLVHERGAELRVLVAWEEPSALIAVGTATAMELVAIEEEHRDAAEELLRQTLTALPEAGGEVLRGHPGPAIAAACEGADLLVVGSRGWGPARRLALGSTSDFLVHHAPCAVLVVPRPAGELAAEPAAQRAAAAAPASAPTAAAAG
ncbi:MAG TPA: universal stress protein [Baekduia sp.]|nr:universal stress protein [Baekduia sp.]